MLYRRYQCCFEQKIAAMSVMSAQSTWRCSLHADALSESGTLSLGFAGQIGYEQAQQFPNRLPIDGSFSGIVLNFDSSHHIHFLLIAIIKPAIKGTVKE